MVFFNYSTMQMAAKVVYYGPGLCGKTTNLQYIYSRTAKESRGEMVSLETETDRTLFFDLLPIDVGSIAGFATRVQLYTVPGQVFYNTTRKLVLKGVDGVVFVADSQRPTLQANIDSFRNLEENIQEMGLSMETVPLVLQYNKRDLHDIASVEELNQALNRGNWPFFEASALTGTGVFETLKGISKLTLLSLKKRLSKDAPRPGVVTRPTAPVARPAPQPQPHPEPAAVGSGAGRGASGVHTPAAAAAGRRLRRQLRRHRRRSCRRRRRPRRCRAAPRQRRAVRRQRLRWLRRRGPQHPRQRRRATSSPSSRRSAVRPCGRRGRPSLPPTWPRHRRRLRSRRRWRRLPRRRRSTASTRSTARSSSP